MWNTGKNRTLVWRRCTLNKMSKTEQMENVEYLVEIHYYLSTQENNDKMAISNL